MISYEVAMGLALVAVFLYAGSMSTSEIVAAQNPEPEYWLGVIPIPTWYALILLPSFVIYVIAMVGETNRAPFDLPEAEGELVGGFHTEYSSLKFALFFLAEYINMATVSALATTLFLGGWHAPWPIIQLWEGADSGYWPLLWFFGKMLLFIFMFIWLRGSLPRLRYDQFMAFGWKRLIPISLVWIIAVATHPGADPGGRRRPRLPPGRRRRPAGPVPGAVLRRRQRRRGRRGRGRAGPGAGRRLRRRLPGPADARRWCGPRRGRPADLRRSPYDGAGHLEHVRRRRRGHLRDRVAGGEVMSESKGFKEQFWDPVAGFGVTFRTMFKKVVTEQYPFEKMPTAPRFHGRHQLNRWPDGLEKCIGCELCAWACPADAIYVEGGSNTDGPTGSASAPASATAASTRSTTCAASCAGCASRRARRARSR